jgi:hypothetical protein
VNDPPKFVSELKPIKVKVGEESSWTLPDIEDPDGDELKSVKISLGAAAVWLKYDDAKREFSTNKALLVD